VPLDRWLVLSRAQQLTLLGFVDAEGRDAVVVVLVNRGRAWSSVDLMTERRGPLDIQLLSRRIVLEGS
jgi:hypothetical protein